MATEKQQAATRKNINKAAAGAKKENHCEFAIGRPDCVGKEGSCRRAKEAPEIVVLDWAVVRST
jgi:hypothetical protein